MSDVYMVYASEDRGIAEEVYGHLEKLWDVWWDDKIVGPFSRAIEDQIPKSKCMVLLLSESSRAKDTVLDELRLAKESELDILIARLDHCKAPYQYGGYSCCSMVDWDGDSDHAGFSQLMRKIATVVPPAMPPKRPISIADSELKLPRLFYSISSYNTSIKPSEAVQALRALQAPSILVSAYDLVSKREPEKMIIELKRYQKSGGFILLDSGAYEASRLEDKGWCVEDFNEAVTNTPHDYVFCFDKMNPSSGKKELVKQVIHAVLRDQKTTSSPVLPIVHAPPLKKGGYKLQDLPYIFHEISKVLKPPMIAIPERELGAGIVARAKMISAIRQELSKLPHYQPIHVLGTGHPWAIAILVAAGADSFDGLEWCRYSLDADFEQISHFHLFDLVGNLDPTVEFAANVAIHNLNYLNSFNRNMQEMVGQEKVEAWVTGILSLKSREPLEKLKVHYPGIFE
ncbi:toll/interleukin-1 receptor domain-containing protein [Saccharospirillum impatiens]|uniref:toll/interleukin-1 receptor domain-containing protein n=1 Tax=Saccharospirillum impatiens TaxID=169438 RepID=UPI00041CFBD2|nr:toll/interleukin-1 receptor domain-containing protein [Saccharospirillum impatiens]